MPAPDERRARLQSGVSLALCATSGTLQFRAGGASMRAPQTFASDEGQRRPRLPRGRQAVSLTSSGDAIHVVRAPAGAGKTHALEAAKEAWVRSGAEVTGCALSARAAAELRDQAALDTTTIARLRVALDHGHRMPVGGVLIVDEAAMVGTRDLAELTRRADDVGCKVVLVGDERQLPEIEAGGAFRAITERHGATELSILRRQRELEERRALEALRDGRTEEWALSLAGRDRIVTAPTSEALRARLVDDWWQAQREGDDALMIAHRRRDVADLNRRARQRMRDGGRLAGPDVAVGELDYAVGDDIACRQNNRQLDLINGSKGTVREVTEVWMRVSLSDGRDVLLPAGYIAEHVEHGYATTAHRAQGSTVDRTFVLGSHELCREWGYTAMSRHREEGGST
jgi:ATP-dependent exoDNAse (exonuclease V) alpha subunit